MSFVVRVLAGDGSQGADVQLTVVPPREAGAEARASAVPLPDGSVYRALPLLAVAGPASSKLLAVGQARLVAVHGELPELRVVVRALWQSTDERSWRAVDDASGLRDAIVEWTRGVGHTVPTELRAAITTIAKGLAEASRNGLGEAQRLRYDLEGRLAAQLDPASQDPLEPLLADAIQLSLALGRAGDEARSAVREGMWAWRTDHAAYHAQRHQVDPSLPERPGRAEALAQPWFATYDAGVRQCAGLERGVEVAVPMLDRMLGYGSTIANARDAQGQEAFNLVATVGTVALGVPALVLTLYGASSVLPLGFNATSLRVATPLVLGALVAVVLALRLPGRHPRSQRLGYAAAAVALVVGLLLAAGFFFAKASTGTPSPQPTPTASP